jgi:hypothetical protein
MENLDFILRQLEDSNATIRFNACEQLRQMPALSADAIFALKRALNDPNAHVTQAAQRALHDREMAGIKTNSPGSSHPVKKVGLIGNLHFAHVLFLIFGTGMVIMTASSGSWGATLFMVCFFISCMIFIGLTSRGRNQKLTEIWSELASQTGLELTQGQSYLLGQSSSPSLAGVYHGHKISITKVVENVAAYEGSIPVVYTLICLKLININDFILTVCAKNFLKKLFSSSTIKSQNAYLDQNFQFEGEPKPLLHKAVQWLAVNQKLLERPDGIIMQTDYPLSAVRWSPPAIFVKGSELSFKQQGILSVVVAQVEFLDMLCNLAELIEYPVGGWWRYETSDQYSENITIS